MVLEESQRTHVPRRDRCLADDDVAAGVLAPNLSPKKYTKRRRNVREASTPRRFYLGVGANGWLLLAGKNQRKDAACTHIGVFWPFKWNPELVRCMWAVPKNHNLRSLNVTT